MKNTLLAAVLVLGVLGLPSCSSSDICDAVKSGQDPIAASGAGYAAAGSIDDRREQAEEMREAAEEIRSSCPEQSNAAARLESVAGTLGV